MKYFLPLIFIMNYVLSIKVIHKNPYLYLNPQTNLTNSILNQSKQKWLLNYKISKTYTNPLDFSNRNCNINRTISFINILLLAQQKTMARPRNLILNIRYSPILNSNKIKPNRIEYFHNAIKKVNPVLLNNNSNIIINLDKQLDMNYEKNYEWLTNNKVTSYLSRSLKCPRSLYNEIKHKIYFKVLYIYKIRKCSYIKEYNIKLFLTTDIDHYNYLDWTTPRLS